MQPATGNVDAVRTRLAIALATLAGFVDALGFITLGGYFVSFMTGNTTRFTVGLSGGQFHEAAIGLALIGLFVAGAIGGFATSHAVPSCPRQAVAALVTTLLLAAILCHDVGRDHATVAAITIAMGAENAILQDRKGRTVSLTYMTGTLVRMSGLIVDACAGGSPFAWLHQFVLWAGLAFGAALGGLAHHWIGLDALWLAVLASAAITVALSRLPNDAFAQPL